MVDNTIQAMRCTTYYYYYECPHCNEKYTVDEFNEEGEYNDEFLLMDRILRKSRDSYIKECSICKGTIEIDNFDED